MIGVKAEQHPKYKTKYRVEVRAEFHRALVQRGGTTALDALLARAIANVGIYLALWVLDNSTL